MAAALSTCYLIFKDENADYANRCLQNARDLYDFANEYQGKYSDSSPQVEPFYKSWGGYQDELCWGALWLYRATGQNSYLNIARGYYSNSIRKASLQPKITLCYVTCVEAKK